MIAQLFVNLFYLYLGLGLLFALWFLFSGAIRRIDHQMQGASWRVRLLLLPGTAALWVVLLLKWLKTAKHGS